MQRDEARELQDHGRVGALVGEHVQLVGEAGQLAQGEHVVGAEGLVAVALEANRLGGAGRGVELLGRQIERHVADGGSVCGVERAELGVDHDVTLATWEGAQRCSPGYRPLTRGSGDRPRAAVRRARPRA